MLPAATPAVGDISKESQTRSTRGDRPRYPTAKNASRCDAGTKPLNKPDSPFRSYSRRKVPGSVPPNRCCWIIVSSRTVQGTPLAKPARYADPTSSANVKSRGFPFTMSFCRKPQTQNWAPIKVPSASIDAGVPRYMMRGSRDTRTFCWMQFFV